MAQSKQEAKSPKPRVLVIGPVFPKGGGVGMVDRILLESDLNDGYEMTVLDTGRTQAGEGKETTLAGINFVYYFRQAFQLLGILIRRHPAIVHQAVTDRIAFYKETSFMLLARLLGAKTVSHNHGAILDVELRESSPFKRRMLLAALRVPHVQVVLSEYWRRIMHEEALPSLNVAVIPNSVSQPIADAMEQVDPAAEKPGCLVLFVGSLGTRKGLLVALKAVPLIRAQVPEARFVFAGRIELGHEKAMIEQACREAEQLGGVEFPGLVTGEVKMGLLREASIFTLPSYNENLPVAILEAMAMGLPVVATPVAGVPELLEDGVNSFLIQPGDHEALADRIVRLAKDPALRHAMGRANMAKVRQEYHPRVFAGRFAQLYESLLAGEGVELAAETPRTSVRG